MLVVEENYVAGVPQTTVAGWAPKGAGWHWDAGLGGRAGWEATIRHLVNTRTTVNASYHGGFWCEHDAAHRACRTILQWIVRTTVAAHSFNPAHCFVPKTGSAREKERFAEVHRILERDSDPNADAIAIAYSGMPAGLAKDLECPVFRADLRNLAQQLVDHPTIVDRPHFGHGWIQPTTRYEADVAPATAAQPTPADLLINPVLYATAPAAEEDDMALTGFTPIVNRRAVIAKGAAARSRPAFDRNDYDAYLIGTEPNQRSRTAVAWVDGTALVANDGTVINPSTKWLLTDSDSHGAIFYHEQDVVALEAIEVVDASCAAEVAQAEQETAAAVNKSWREWLATAPKS